MIDIIIVAIYLLIVLAIGIFGRSAKQDFHNFAKVRDSLATNKLVVISTIFASAVGGGTIFGIAEKTYSLNLSYSYAIICNIPLDLLIAYLIVPRVAAHHHKAETAGDIMADYYGKYGRFITFLSTVIVGSGFVAAQVNISSRIFENILEVDFILGIIISYTIIIIYSTIGGLRSVLFTNLFEFFIILLAIPIISYFAISELGFSFTLENLPIDKILQTEDNNLIQTSFALFLCFSVMKLYPSFIQRILINKDAAITSSAIYIKSLILFIFMLFVSANGILSYMLLPDVDSHFALNMMINQTVPSGIQGIVICGLLSAVMSTASSELNVIAVSFAKDFAGGFLQVKKQKTLLLIARSANFLIGLLIILIVISFHSVVDLIIFISGFWGAISLVPLVFASFGVLISTKQMIMTSLCGGISFLATNHLSYYGVNYLGTFIGTLVSLFVFCGIIMANKFNSK